MRDFTLESVGAAAGRLASSSPHTISDHRPHPAAGAFTRANCRTKLSLCCLESPTRRRQKSCSSFSRHGLFVRPCASGSILQFWAYRLFARCRIWSSLHNDLKRRIGDIHEEKILFSCEPWLQPPQGRRQRDAEKQRQHHAIID